MSCTLPCWQLPTGLHNWSIACWCSTAAASPTQGAVVARDALSEVIIPCTRGLLSAAKAHSPRFHSELIRRERLSQPRHCTGAFERPHPLPQGGSFWMLRPLRVADACVRR